MDGRGTFINATGGIYVGCFIDGKRDGIGAYYTRDGDHYDGEWKDNMMKLRHDVAHSTDTILPTRPCR